jgi:hypothetical protein
VIGGPQGDAGLTGRKIIVDTYGGWGAHGGGAFSGKDFSKVDRSAAYTARWIAKSLIAAGLARRALVQLSYAIGVAEPLSIFVDTYGTGKKSNAELVEIIRNNWDLRPGVIGMLLHLLIAYASSDGRHTCQCNNSISRSLSTARLLHTATLVSLPQDRPRLMKTHIMHRQPRLHLGEAQEAQALSSELPVPLHVP